MANHDYVIANGTGAAVRSDLNNALAAIVSNNSSSSEPSTRYAYQWWADTTTNKLKLRNSANNGWNTICELDGTMLMEDGSATAPGLAFESDQNTGLFRSAPDRINFVTGGVERLEIGSSEVVLNNPSNDVDFRVESNGSTHMLFVDAGNDRIGINTSTPNHLLDLVTTTDARIRLKTSSSSSSNESTLILQRGSNESAIKNKAGGLEFFTGGLTTEDMRLDSSGRLLVGTSSARANFNDGTDESHIQLEGTTQNNSTISTVRNSNNDGPAHLVLGKSRGAAANSTTIVQSGDTIGHINFEGADGSHLIRAAQISAVVDGTPGANDMPGRLVFSTCSDGTANLTERMRITSGGVCQMGAYVGNGNGTGWSFETTNTASAHETSTNSSFTHIFWINGNGVVGGISTNGSATSYNTSSDYRLKENVTAVTDGITRVKQLSPKRFNFIVDGTTTVDGFIAHEAQTVVPEAVTGTHDEVDTDGNAVMQGIDQSKFVPLLTAALQEAIAKIETLETKVAALEAG